MYQRQVNEQSPLRILEASIHGGLGKGNVGVVMARAGVGKTACLVQFALGELLRGEQVLHIALGGQGVEHTENWYEALFDDLAEVTELQDRDNVRRDLARRRIIQSHATSELTPELVERTSQLLKHFDGFDPAIIIIDGHDWQVPMARTAATLGALHAVAERLNAEVWVGAQMHREDAVSDLKVVPAPCADLVDVIDVVLALQPEDDHVAIRLLKDHNHAEVGDLKLELRCDTLRLVARDRDHAAAQIPMSSRVLLSGGAQGAEAAFGECAEKWKLREVHYSFTGRTVARKQGLVELSEAELKRGDVSIQYLEQHMHRRYPKTTLFRNVLRSIWHQVNTAGQVFVVGLILEDGTVKGGTGWAAELAKHLKKPLFVFDQEKKAWFGWRNDGWTAEPAPIIRARRFTGTGSRFLSDDGAEAISALFERSFG